MAINSTTVTPVKELSGEDKLQLQQLYAQNYSDSSHFQRDLDEKHWVLRIFESSQLVGFSTLTRQEHLLDEPTCVFFSGDTLVLPSHRHRYDLPRHWGRFVFEQVEKESLPCVWFLICSGFRTYRFLSTFFCEFFPRHDRNTPSHIQAHMAQLAQGRYGDLYDDQTGLIYLKSANLESIPPRQLDQHGQFFLKVNPGWQQGHELVCYTWLHPANLTAAGKRMIASG